MRAALRAMLAFASATALRAPPSAIARLGARRASAAAAASDALKPPPPSPLVKYSLRGRDIYVKRDDQYRLTHAFGAGVCGNKARKLFTLSEAGPGAGAVASLGGHQSNALPSLAALCRARGVPFYYICKPVPRWLRGQPAGNYARALALGVELLPLAADDYRLAAADDAFRSELLADYIGSDDFRWVPQGGACGDAEAGVAMLADELADDLRGLGRARVVIPGGTGTTALYVTRRLAEIAPDIEVCAVACATSAETLERQMVTLGGDDGPLPAILEPDRDHDHRFGRPCARDLAVWRECAHAGLHVDLVYAPHAIDTMLRRPDDGAPTCYVHCGGVEGVATQLTRYRHAGLVDRADTQ